MASPERAEKPQHLHYLNEFRVEACPLFKQHQCQQHRPYTCFNWHFANQRRRRPIRKSDGSFNYSPDIYCDKYDENTGICPDGDDCIYLHRVSGDVERKYHLRYYKTAQCVHSTDSRGQCVKNGAYCAFAHTAADLRLPQFDQHEAGFATSLDPEGRDRTSFVVEDQSWHSPDHVLSNYKTELCRKPARLCRQGYACPFYHNSKDRRRPPAKFRYRSTPCPAAKSVDEWLDPELCEAGDSCQYCHTRTEQQFHPEIYKSTKCNDMLEHGYCPRAVFCAFAHHDSELYIQRTPHLANSAQHSPKEASTPTTNGDSMRFSSPISPIPVSGSSSTPTYSSVLKLIPTKAYDDILASSYPKAPGCERGPLSPNRNDNYRLRTHSLNIGHLDMSSRNEFTGFDSASGSLPSHPSLYRSDSGLHTVAGTLEELTLDLAPIDENSSKPPLSELFGSNSQINYPQPMSSPGCISGNDPLYNPPLPSFGDSIFGAPTKAMHSPSGAAGTANVFNSFDNTDSSSQDMDDLQKPRTGDQISGDRHEVQDVLEVAIWEDSLKQARKACEAWQAQSLQYRMRAEQAELERNRLLFEREQLVSQLESMKLYMATNNAMANMANSKAATPVSAPVSTSDTESSVWKNNSSSSIFPNSQFNMFSADDPIGPACARCGRDRRSDNRNGCPLCSS